MSRPSAGKRPIVAARRLCKTCAGTGDKMTPKCGDPRCGVCCFVLEDCPDCDAVHRKRLAERARFIAMPVKDLDNREVPSPLHPDEVPYHLFPGSTRCGAWAGDWRTRCDRTVHVPDDADDASTAGGRHVAFTDGDAVVWFGHRIPTYGGRGNSSNHLL